VVGVGGTWGVWGAVTRRGTLEVGMGSIRSYPLAVLPWLGAKRRAGKYMSHVRPGWGLAQLPAWAIGPVLCSKERVGPAIELSRQGELNEIAGLGCLV
jgi:hypothetical protein